MSEYSYEPNSDAETRLAELGLEAKAKVRFVEVGFPREPIRRKEFNKVFKGFKDGSGVFMKVRPSIFHILSDDGFPIPAAVELSTANEFAIETSVLLDSYRTEGAENFSGVHWFVMDSGFSADDAVAIQ